MRTGRVRVLRGAVVSGLSTAVALVFHVAGGAPVPGALGILMPVVLTTLVAAGLMTARPRLLPTLAASALAQVAFHTLFVLGTPVGAGGTGHAHHGGATPAQQLAIHGTDQVAAVTGADPRMWGAHALAAVVTALLVHRSEQLVRLMVRLAHLVLAVVVGPARTVVVTGRAARPVLEGEPVADALRRLVLAATSWRGPPALAR